MNSNGTGIFCPTEIWQVIQGNADAPHASGVGSLNWGKETFREVEVKKGERLGGGDRLDLFNPNGRLYGEFEAIFPARDCVGFACLYEIILIVPVGEKDFYLSVWLIVYECQVTVPIWAKGETNFFTYAIGTLICPDIYIETRPLLFEVDNRDQGISQECDEKCFILLESNLPCFWQIALCPCHDGVFSWRHIQKRYSDKAG